MNKERKRRLRNVKEELTSVLDEVNSILDEEDEARDNMPENLQASEQYSQSELASDTMGEVADLVREAIGAIEYII